MLKQRTVTAAVLILVLMILLFLLTPLAFAFFAAAVVILGAWEYSKLIGLFEVKKRNFYLALVAGSLILGSLLPVDIVLIVAILWWMYVMYRLNRYQKTLEPLSFELRVASGPLVLVPCWVAVADIRLAVGGARILFFLFLLIWLADIAAYFYGTAYGKRKLAENISPNKTYEGLYAALVSAAVFGIAGVLLFHEDYKFRWPFMIVLSVITVFFSVVGDLFESMLKRQQGVKDSGRLFPGHGGMLDRIDSLTAAAPVFALGIHLLGITP